MAKKHNQPIHPLLQLKFSYTIFRVLKIFSTYLIDSISLATNIYSLFKVKLKCIWHDFCSFIISFKKTDFILSWDRKYHSKKREWMKLIAGLFNQFFWLTWSVNFFLLKKWINTNVFKIIYISSNENHGRALSQLTKFLKNTENGNFNNGF